MANLKIPQKNQKRLMILAGVALVIIIILYLTVIRSPGAVPPGFEAQPTGRSALPEINTAILEGETFGQFRVWNSLPIEVGPTGKENPFSK